MNTFFVFLWEHTHYCLEFTAALFIFEKLFTRRARFYIRLPLALIIFFSSHYILDILLPPSMELFRLTDFSFANTLAVAIYSYLFLFVGAGALKIAYANKYINLIFWMTAGYAVQHFFFNFNQVFEMFIPLQAETPIFYIAYLGQLLAICTLLRLLFQISLQHHPEKMNNSAIIAFSMLIFIVTLIIGLKVNEYFGVLPYLSKIEPETLGLAVITRVVLMIVCILALIVQFGIFEISELKQKNNMLLYLMKQEKLQYEFSKATIEKLNLKAHDLKYFLCLAEGKQRTNELQELCEVIEDFGALWLTGNETLDNILKFKSSYCRNAGIDLTCVADGKSLAFMNPIDIYSLFGNIIDNAVEAVMKLNKENRVIELEIRAENGLIIISELNYCTGEIRFENGIPVSTKGDTGSHGFGYKSIAMTTEKYGGAVSSSVADNIFELKVIIPQQVACIEHD